MTINLNNGNRLTLVELAVAPVLIGIVMIIGHGQISMSEKFTDVYRTWFLF